MIYRQALVTDIPEIQRVRHAVRENRLSRPELVPDTAVEDYITRRGKGWVCEEENTILGFAIADLEEESVWALFVHPDFENKGIGTHLQKEMLSWYFNQGKKSVWLSTAPHTRAEKFYEYTGWQAAGTTETGEIRFLLNKEEWQKRQEQKPILQSFACMALVVKDYDEAISFYTSVLGFILEEDTRLSESKRWVRVRPHGPGQTSILLAKAANEEQSSRIGNQTGGRVFLFLHTNDFDRDYQLYQLRGVEFVREPVVEPYGKVAVFKDLYGNLWDLIQPVAGNH